MWANVWGELWTEAEFLNENENAKNLAIWQFWGMCMDFLTCGIK